LSLTLIGSMWRVYAGRFIAGHSNSTHLAGNSLAVAGPYVFGRHPLYLANVLAGIGMVLFANCLSIWGTIVLIFLLCAHHGLLATTEERFMAETWGASYQDYLKSTSRWLGFPDKLYSPLVAQDAVHPIPGVWRRQGANLGKLAAGLIILWTLANHHTW
jgi:protein-S-isoprenylcysteine O-methyltransferase Ste14